MRRFLCVSLLLTAALQSQGVTVLLRAESPEGETVLKGMAAAVAEDTPEADWARKNLLLVKCADGAGGLAMSNTVRVAAADTTGTRRVSLDEPCTWDARVPWLDVTREYARLSSLAGGEGGDLLASGARLLTAIVHVYWGSPGDPRVAAADPFILNYGGKYYLYGTTSSSCGFRAYVSEDLVHWSEAPGLAKDGYVFYRGDGFGERMFWAPEVHVYRGRFYLFYSADRCCCVAVADSPLGPFRNPAKEPLFRRPGGQAIDNSLFVDDDGTRWMAFSDNERFALIELTEDLLSVKPETLFHPFDGPLDAWQKGTEEGPSIIKRNGRYLVLFSGDGCESQDYAVGVGYADRMTGPWRRMKDYRFLHRAGGLTGTGHGSPFQKADGSWHYVFHAHETPTIMGHRRTYLAPMTFDRGTPRLTAAPVSCIRNNRQARVSPSRLAANVQRDDSAGSTVLIWK